MQFDRRRFVQGLLGLALARGEIGRAASAAANPAARQIPTLNVKDFGTFGDGKRPDRRQLQEALDRARQYPTGATLLFPPGDYFLGAADDTYQLLHGLHLEKVRLVGERATISCRSLNGVSNMLVLDGCRNVAIQGLTFRDHGLRRDINWLGAAAIRLANDTETGCIDVAIRDCTFDSVLAALVSRDFKNGGPRCRGIVLEDSAISRSYYGINLQDNGDDVTIRRLRCSDVKRSYYPYGVSHHDVELEALDNATGFSDVILGSERRPTSHLRLRIRSRGKRGGDALVTFGQTDIGDGGMRNVDVHVDIDDVDCRLGTVFVFRSVGANRKWQRTTTRRWENIAIDGHARICARTSLIEAETVQAQPGVLRIGPALAEHPQLPSRVPGFNVEVRRA